MDKLDRLIQKFRDDGGSVIGLLQDICKEERYLSRETLERVSEQTEVPLSRLYGLATFYTSFPLKPRGRHVVRICMGTACHVRGAPRILDELCRVLDTSPGEVTADGEFTLETVSCLGACALGPVVVIDDAFYHANPGKMGKLIEDFRKGEAEPVETDLKPADTSGIDYERLRAAGLSVSVCGGTGCQAYGCELVASALQRELEHLGLAECVEFVKTGCHGFCEQGPLVVVRPANILYRKVAVKDIPEIVRETVVNGNVIERLVYHDADGTAFAKEDNIPFYAHQQRTIFGGNGHISPDSIDQYIDKCDGYTALRKALEMGPEAVISTITEAGIRGRGGGGFPTGLKWGFCRKAEGEPKYIICNADEGDPGAYMDRSLLEGNPHRVLEGMAIGALAIGASHGFIYVRNEYPLAVRNVETAVEQARERGFLGDNICGSELCFDVKIVRGAGAFVCGEETALIASIEGLVGEPRTRPPYPANAGYMGHPTNINNVETWVNVPLIIGRGAEWFTSVGTERSRGTKVFSLVGKIRNTGLVEVPMGMPLRKIIYDIGGGVPNGREFKAVQTGGPSGGCIPAENLDLPVDYDALKEVGSMMGSGGMIVMDEDTCMVEMARYFLSFTQDESCGKCPPCREGTRHMLAILTDITEGRGKEGDIELLESMGKLIKETAICGLGNTAPNPVLTTIRYFRHEYEAHIRDKKCPAHVCKPLITYMIEEEPCVGCHACFKACPTHCISGEVKKPHVIDQEKCVKCGMCREVCRFKAVRCD